MQVRIISHNVMQPPLVPGKESFVTNTRCQSHLISKDNYERQISKSQFGIRQECMRERDNMK